MKHGGGSYWPVLLGMLVQMASIDAKLVCVCVLRSKTACVAECLYHDRPPTSTIHMDIRPRRKHMMGLFEALLNQEVICGTERGTPCKV